MCDVLQFGAEAVGVELDYALALVTMDRSFNLCSNLHGGWFCRGTKKKSNLSR